MRYELKSLKREYEYLEKKFDKLDDKYEAELEAQQDKHEKEVRKLKRSHAIADEELAVLKELNLSTLKLAKEQVSLETREALLKAKNDEFDTIAKELAKATDKAEKAREEGEKKGYADGVADGLREATKITADDRRMMGQVAALAAASHQGDATSKIADAIVKDMAHALPATTKKQ